MQEYMYILYIFNSDYQFMVISSWRQTVWNYDICTVVVSDIDFEGKNNF